MCLAKNPKKARSRPNADANVTGPGARCILIYPADGHGANRVARERRAAEGGEWLELGSRGLDSNLKVARTRERARFGEGLYGSHGLVLWNIGDSWCWLSSNRGAHLYVVLYSLGVGSQGT